VKRLDKLAELERERAYTARVQQLLYAVIQKTRGFTKFHDQTIRDMLSDAWEELRMKPTALSPQDLEQLSTEIDRYLVRKNFSELLARIAYTGDRLVVQRRGRPMAALISIRDLHRLEELELLHGSEQHDSAIAAARASRQAILAERKGAYVTDVASLIHEAREERDDEVTSLR
jgi:prevent-host-death family protein